MTPWKMVQGEGKRSMVLGVSFSALIRQFDLCRIFGKAWSRLQGTVYGLPLEEVLHQPIEDFCLSIGEILPMSPAFTVPSMERQPTCQVIAQVGDQFGDLWKNSVNIWH